MTPPPTSDNRPRRLSRLFSPLREKAIETYYLVEDFIPRLTNAHVWPRLLRLPNLLTVPGDILAGFLLAPSARAADWAQLPLAFLAGGFLYSAGLILNDLFDYAEDLRDRPDRPLPSGRISREAAAVAVLVCLWVAGFLAAFFDALPVALPLMACLVLYDIGLKRRPWLGPLLMGACRAGNLLLGTAAASTGLLFPAPLLAASLLGAFIASVTHLARQETLPNTRFPPERIGRLLRCLLPLQALFCLAAVHRFPANFLGLLLLPLSRFHRRLSSRFPPS